MFPKQLAERVIDIFTCENDVVLDPFMGIGSTILAAYNRGRKGIGFELSRDFVDIASNRFNSAKELYHERKNEPEIFQEDSRSLDKHLRSESVHLCLTSPPYWDILNMRRTADGKKIKNYSDSNVDLGNIEDYGTFLNELKQIFQKVFHSLVIGGHCIVVVMDIRKKDMFYPFHSDVAIFMQKIGFSFEDIIIWDRQQEYNNMRPLGYPYVFRVNKVHEYVLIFKKKISK